VLLAQHKLVPEELVTSMSQGDVDSVAAHTMKLLITSLPSDDEVGQTFSSSLACSINTHLYFAIT